MKIIEKQAYAKLNEAELNTSFMDACRQNNLKLVKFLLTSRLLSYHPDINLYNGAALILACEYANKDLVEYLLNGKGLKKHIDIKHLNNSTLLNLLNGGSKEIAEYLIIEKNIKNPYTTLKEIGPENIMKLFKMRSLNKRLEKNLEIKIVSKKLKI